MHKSLSKLHNLLLILCKAFKLKKKKQQKLCKNEETVKNNAIGKSKNETPFFNSFMTKFPII